MTLASRFALLTTCLAFFGVACGGGGPSRPKPLSNKFDESYLDAVSYDKKEVMFKAQNEYQRARAKYREAESKLAEARTMFQVAKNERDQAVLGEKSAAEKRKSAEATGDMNRVNAASREARIAELGRRAADEKVAAREAEVKYLEKLVLYAEEEMYHQEARFEMTKAKMARDNNIQPKDFQYAPFEQQAQDRSKRAQRAKLIADQERQKSSDRKRKWEAAQKQVDAARGVPSDSSGDTGSSPETGGDTF
jgi:hypothetical protein